MKTAHSTYIKIIITEWAAVLLAIIAFYFMALQPQQEYNSGLSQELHELSGTAKALTSRLDHAMEQEVLKTKDLLSYYIIMADDNESLTFKTQQLAEGQNLLSFSCKEATDLRRGINETLKHLQEERASVSFISNFKTFARLLYALESHTPFIFVDSFRVSSDHGMQGLTTVSMELAALKEKPSSTGQPISR